MGHKGVFSRQILRASQEVFGSFRDTDSSRDAVALHLVGDENTFSKDVVSDHLRADDPSDDFSRMDSNPHVQNLEVLVVGLVPHFLNDV